MPQEEYSDQDIYNKTHELAEQWEKVHDEAEKELYHLGFYRVAQPEFTCPILDPKSLTTADLASYTEMHARFQRWHNYAENTQSYVESILIGIKRQLKQLEAQLLLMYGSHKNPATGKPFSVDDRKIFVENNPRYVELLQDQTKFEQMHKQMESQVSNLSRSGALISRHIELRKLDVEGDRVGHNMPGRGMYNR